MKKSIKKSFVQAAGLAPEAMGCVRLTVIDNTNLYIENHGRINECSPRRVSIEAGPFLILIEGAELVMEYFGREDISVRGEIESIRYEIMQRG